MIFHHVVALLCATRALATPYEAFPFDEQLPTVARVDEDYTFTLNNETYLSTVSAVTYYAEDLPSWLSFDSDSRTFTGTPSSDDVTDSATFTLIGEDSNGNYSNEYSLVVSDSDGPEASSDFTVLGQLAEYGQTNGVDSLVLSPGEVFNITFDSKTFDSDDTIKAYYGRSSDRTPLPSWMFFDSANLRFSGVAPPANSQIAPGEKYSFMFIATDYAGFAGGWVDFGITVGAHELTTTLKDTIHINGSAGDTLSYEIPLENVYEDGTEVTAANISAITLNGAPDWLSLNNYTLVGDVPDDYEDDGAGTFKVTLYDNYSNDVSLFFTIETISSLFAVSSFNYVNATRGEYFQYYFVSSDFTDYASTNITVEFDDDDSDWLVFHESNLTINGDTPDDFDEATVTVIATSDDQVDEMSFKIYGIDPIDASSSSSKSHSSTKTSSSSSSSHSATASATAASSTTSSTAEATSTAADSDSLSSGGNKKALAIGLGVALPLLALIIAAILIFCCCYKRRNKDDGEDKEGSPKISGPILGNPANGPNGRSPVAGGTAAAAAYSPSTSSSMDSNEKADWNEPHRLGALNVLKLDEKDYYEHGSTSSSTTNVATFDSVHDDTRSSLYQDALQAQSTDQLMGPAAVGAAAAAGTTRTVAPDTVPKKSWRQTIDSRINRESLNSLATVSTNELFSIRLAEDDDIERDPRKSNLGFRDSAFLGSTASSILTRDDSGNIQRLDSDGNIVGTVKPSNNRSSRATNLDILKEEDTPQPHLGKFEPDTSFSSMNTGSTGEEFYPVATENGNVKWEQQDKAQFSFEKENSQQQITQHKNSSKAKLKDFHGRISTADISNDVSQSTGETAEIESV